MSSSKGRMINHQPRSLLECAAHMVGMIITKPAVDLFHHYMRPQYISAEERRYVDSFITRTAEYYDKLIPKPLHDIVTKHSLKCLPQDFVNFADNFKLKHNYLDIVLRSHTTSFDFTEYLPCSLSLLRSLNRLKHLQHLKLYYLFDEYLSHATSALKDMKKLDSFECESCCDKVLKIVCNNNRSLKKLNICMSYSRITDSSLPFILNLQNLEELNIKGCDFSEEAHFQILSSLPNLKNISADHIHLFLAQINDDRVKLPFQSVTYTCYTKVDIENLIKYCPLISKLKLDIMDESVNDLSGLSALSNLKKLKVYSDSLKYSEIKYFLELKGNQLIELHLFWLDDASEVRNEVKRLCPNLNNFLLNIL